MKLILFTLFMVAICVEAAQIELSWKPKPINALTIFSTTNVNYTIASLTETTNRVRQQWYAGKYGNILSSQILNSWAYYYASLQDHTLVCADMLSNWQPFALIPAGVTSFVATVDAAHMRFFTVQDDGSGSVGLGWDAANPGLNVTGYRLYSGNSTRNYTNVMLLGKVTTTTVTGLVKGSTNYFSLTAIGAGGESGYSSEVKAPVSRQDYQVFIKRI